MKLICKILLTSCFTVFINLSFSFAQQTNASMPFDMIFVGYDNDIGGFNSEKIGILSMIDIGEGFNFGLINMIKDAGQWKTNNGDELVQISFKIKSGFQFEKGSLFEIKNINGQIEVFSDNINVTHQFEINGLKDPSYEFLKTTGSYLSLYSGYFLTNQKEILLGTVLDALSIGISKQTLSGLNLDDSLDGKDIFTTDNPNDGGGEVDISNCRLCDILLIILNPDNWIFINGTPQDDVDLSDFNLEDCAEIDCEDGVLEIDTINGAIHMTLNPCSREIVTYKWQKWINGIFVTVAEANGPIVVPYILNPENCSNEKYRLVIICENGCEYFDEIDIECTPECEMSFYVVQDSCTLTAYVEDCTNPSYTWWYVDSSNSNTEVGNGQSIVGNKDGNYYVVISGCDGCDPEPSSYYLLEGCKDCNCTQEGVLDSCIIIFETYGCLDYTDFWEYSENGEDNWTTINFHGEIYEPTKDGYYRRTLINGNCEHIDTIIPVSCILTCEDFNATYYSNQECQIEIDYTGCLDVIDIQINYAVNNTNFDCDSNLNYVPGGGYVVDNINNGLDGFILIEPDYDNTCYEIILTCANGCTIDLYIWIGQCCQGDLTIDADDDDCVIYTTNVPCSGTFTYTWIIDGTPQQSNTGQSVPPLTPTSNGDYQLEIICADGCEFSSIVEQINCIDPPCNSEALITPDACVLTATVTNCPNAQYQWQIDTGSGFQNIPGETNQIYIATSDDPVKIIVSNCENCDNEEISFEYTPMGCDDNCDCATNVWVDSECILQSSDSDCEGIAYISWWKSDNGGVTWYNFPESAWQSSFVPPSNGLYKKLIEMAPWTGCPDVEDEANIDCLDECDNVVILTPSITEDCYLKATWEGCFDFEEDDIGWYFTNSSNCPTGSGTSFPTTLPSAGTIEEFENNPMEGKGHLIVDPNQGPGCYFFNFQCAGCEVQQVWIEWEECCEDCIPNFYFSEECNIEFETIADEECYNNLISFGYSATYILTTTTGTNSITEQEYFEANTIGWYKISFSHNSCNPIETFNINANNECPLEGEATYDCLSGLSLDISGGTQPYTATWGSDSDYPDLEGDVILEGDLLPYNESMPIIITDNYGDTIIIFLPVIDCICTDTEELTSPREPYIVTSWSIYIDDIESQFSGEWSDFVTCWAANTSEDLEQDIIDFITNNCTSVYTPVVEIDIGQGVSITISVDAFCGIQTITFDLEACFIDDTAFLDLNLYCIDQARQASTSSINEPPSSEQIKIFPNPTNSSFNLKITQPVGPMIQLRIYNTQGQLVSKKVIRTRDDNIYQITTESIKSGLYYVWVESNSGIIGYDKLIIIK